MVCHCCGANRETVLRKFGGQEVALEGIKGHGRLTGVFRDIPADRRVPNFGAHGVMLVSIAGVNGIVRVLVSHGGVSRKSAATMVQGVLNGARKVARTVRLGKWGADKANAKGQVRIGLGAAAHFVKARLWGPLLQLVAPHVAWTPSIEWCYPQHKCYAPRSRKFSKGGVSSTLCGPKTDNRFFNPRTEVSLGIGPGIGGSFGGRNASKNFPAPASPVRTSFQATTYYGTTSALLNILSVGAVWTCETICS